MVKHTLIALAPSLLTNKWREQVRTDAAWCCLCKNWLPFTKFTIAQLKRLSEGQTGTCAKCLCDYHRQRRLLPAVQLQMKAHRAVRLALLSGRLVKKPCETCGRRDSVIAHHDDYTKPLDVRWFCRKHHSKEHKRNDTPENKQS